MASFNAMFRSVFCPGDSIASSYRLEKQIGTGSHAIVWQGKSLQSGESVALKQMSFDLSSEKVKRTYREVKLLQHFAKQENIVTPLDLVTNNTKEKFESVFLVMDLCQTDLHKLLRSSQKLTQNHIKLFSFQLLRAVRTLHNANVVHRDLKPQNILILKIDKLYRVMLCDFGTGRFAADTELRQTSLNCVTTPYYCAPEGILDKDVYSNSVDIWALGCIVAEMIKCTPLFQGRDPKHQLQLILDICGKPTLEDLRDFPESSKKRFLLDYNSPTINSIEDQLPQDVEKDAVDLIQKLLVFHPKKRLTASQAYDHRYLAHLNQGTQTEGQLEAFEDLETSRENLTAEEWRELLWEEIETYQKKKDQDVSAAPTEQPAENDLWGFL